MREEHYSIGTQLSSPLAPGVGRRLGWGCPETRWSCPGSQLPAGFSVVCALRHHTLQSVFVIFHRPRTDVQSPRGQHAPEGETANSVCADVSPVGAILRIWLGCEPATGRPRAAGPPTRAPRALIPTEQLGCSFLHLWLSFSYHVFIKTMRIRFNCINPMTEWSGVGRWTLTKHDERLLLTSEDPGMGIPVAKT